MDPFESLGLEPAPAPVVALGAPVTVDAADGMGSLAALGSEIG
ncbi:MAG: hypothetical protein ABSB75_02585 [Candidatus Limnocylindrales bacterium]